MKLVPMRFASYTWHHNPKSLKITCDKSVAVLSVPYSNDVVQQFGDKPILISGTGELYGDDCIKQYNRLYELYEKSASGVLCIPGIRPIYAHIKSLDMHLNNTPSVITYGFEFIGMGYKNPVPTESCYAVPKPGETLWDISYTHSITIEKLIELNPSVSDIFNLNGIERIRIC